MAFNLFGVNQSDVPQYQAPAPYQQLFGGQTNQLINQQLSGVISPAQSQQFQNTFNQGIAQTNASSFGMPVGAANSQLANLASQNAMQQELFGQQLQQTGLQNAYNQNNQGLQAYGMQNQNLYNQYQSQVGAFEYANDPKNQGLFGQLVGAGINFGTQALLAGG